MSASDPSGDSGGDSQRTLRSFTDALGRAVEVSWPPQRIVSLVPSLSDTLAAIDLDDEVIAITRFCTEPSRWRKEKRLIGGTKDPKVEEILSLQPDLIIANREENRREDVEALSARVPVYVTEPNRVSEAIEMIRALGPLVDRTDAAERLAASIEAAFTALSKRGERPRRTLYLIWRRPWMAAGRETFIGDVLTRGGFESCCAGRYPALSDDELRALEPELVLLSSEPYAFRERHRAELEELCPGAGIRLVDGMPFSWYGPQLLRAPALLKELFPLTCGSPERPPGAPFFSPKMESMSELGRAARKKR